mgnify:CR=1 FL=1
MGLGIFNKLSAPIVLKEDSNAEEQLRQMEYYLLVAPEATKQVIERDKQFVKYGIAGENAIMYELKNSHIPMYIIHDLYLEHNGCTAQIDFLIITRKVTILIESKNLYGNIFVDSNGNFIRRTGNGKMFRQEGMYSPITQNERHLALIKEMRKGTKNFLTRGLFENNFDNNYRSLIVMANTKSIIDYRYAPKVIKDKIVRADGLVRKINEICSDNNISEMFGLLEKLGFGYIVNSQALWGCYDTVPALSIAELIHEKDSSFITVIKYLWNGRKKALQI